MEQIPDACINQAKEIIDEGTRSPYRYHWAVRILRERVTELEEKIACI